MNGELVLWFLIGVAGTTVAVVLTVIIAMVITGGGA